MMVHWTRIDHGHPGLVEELCRDDGGAHLGQVVAHRGRYHGGPAYQWSDAENRMDRWEVWVSVGDHNEMVAVVVGLEVAKSDFMQCVGPKEIGDYAWLHGIAQRH